MASTPNQDPSAWQPGDPVAQGVVILPDGQAERQYGAACRTELVDGMARQWLRSEQERRPPPKIPEGMQEDVQKRIRDLRGRRSPASSGKREAAEDPGPDPAPALGSTEGEAPEKAPEADMPTGEEDDLLDDLFRPGPGGSSGPAP